MATRAGPGDTPPSGPGASWTGADRAGLASAEHGAAASPAPMFELSGVGAEVPGRTLLHPLTLTIPGTAVCGLIGHNGSGKTTLLRLLARQRAPSWGRVRFAGRDMAAWGRREFARHLAYMPQDPALDPAMTVRELVAVGRFPWHGTLGRVSDRDRAAARDAMVATGVDGLADRAILGLSGGERQRAVIALCVAQGQTCLLLDEPTSALDVKHQVQVLEVIRSLNRDRGIGVVMVLHDINLAGRYCDTLIGLREGRLFAQGPPGAIMQADVLSALYATALGVLPHPAGLPSIAYVP